MNENNDERDTEKVNGNVNHLTNLIFSQGKWWKFITFSVNMRLLSIRVFYEHTKLAILAL